jgi:glutamate dehydrogenase
VQRHFQELGKDIQKEASNVMGIDSMGDDALVMVCYYRSVSAYWQLLADNMSSLIRSPLTNEAPSKERKRLFDLAGSSWNNYDCSLIAEGGCVYTHTHKDIPLSAELKKRLGGISTSVKARYQHFVQEIKNTLPVNLIPYIVLSKELEDLTDYCRT